MKLCYLVYREDNVMVYESQVLEYLRAYESKNIFDSIELLLFRHEKNLTKGKESENRIKQYIKKGHTFWSFPVLSMIQLKFDVLRLKNYLQNHYDRADNIAVICRGDLAAYIGTRAFSGYPNSRILYDNRGLAFEESLMSYPNSIIHKVNRNIKRKALLAAKDFCDSYNFVTTNMREYFIKHYQFDENIPYTIIPTLYQSVVCDEIKLQQIRQQENYHEDDTVIGYIGSTAAWQSMNTLVSTIAKIGQKMPKAKFLILTNGGIPEMQKLTNNIKKRIVIKNIPHNKMNYYLQIIDIGIIVRDNTIINHVAAPTKIAEYLTNGIKILYSGDIGIIDDLKEYNNNELMINMDTDEHWLEHLVNAKKEKHIDQRIAQYFDMDRRQDDTYKMLIQSFFNKKHMLNKH
ncbi:hypothetical protein [Acidaminococcus massiliensis]|jgi:hypothetical protein|uniref:hypothetical protein n=1 Tax=Acidaminococcus massiliensis TaxID=1852375 RepID=UPI0023EF84A9|nr:hypothetical protein [Acidaminococcus massiliensis]